eukprot:scaffold21750_cov19-Tisochrysis_lutea.AAC.1
MMQHHAHAYAPAGCAPSASSSWPPIAEGPSMGHEAIDRKASRKHVHVSSSTSSNNSCESIFGSWECWQQAVQSIMQHVRVRHVHVQVQTASGSASDLEAQQPCAQQGNGTFNSRVSSMDASSLAIG